MVSTQVMGRNRVNAVVIVVMVFLSSCVNTNRASRGYLIDLATAPERCGDGRWIVVTATGKHRARINGDPNKETPIAQTVLTVQDALRFRAEKLIYVDSESGVLWGEFIEVLDAVRPEAEVISLITPSVKVMAEQLWCLAPSCGRCDRIRSMAANQ
jgi:hypothetical protein